jgi:cytidine deaminase
MPGIVVPVLPLEPGDEQLIAAAAAAIRRAYSEHRHVVGAAVRCASGEIYTGVNVHWSTGGPCAEPVALGAAISNGEHSVLAVVAVEGTSGAPIPPCGNCRQMLVAYAPEAVVIVPYQDCLVRVQVTGLLPVPYLSRAESGAVGLKPS